MAYKWSNKAGTKTGFSLEIDDLSEKAKALAKTARATYKANQDANAALWKQIAADQKIDPELVNFSWSMRGDINVRGAAKKAAKTDAKSEMTIAEYLAQNA